MMHYDTTILVFDLQYVVRRINYTNVEDKMEEHGKLYFTYRFHCSEKSKWIGLLKFMCQESLFHCLSWLVAEAWQFLMGGLKWMFFIIRRIVSDVTLKKKKRPLGNPPKNPLLHFWYPSFMEDRKKVLVLGRYVSFWWTDLSRSGWT